MGEYLSCTCVKDKDTQPEVVDMNKSEKKAPNTLESDGIQETTETRLRKDSVIKVL